MMPVGLLSNGEKGQIIRISEIKEQKRAQSNRLEDLGIRQGQHIEMLNNDKKETILIKIENSRLALSRGLAMKIFVRRAEHES